jgi:microcystin-dependent protein
LALWQWQTTASANATSDPTMNWSEGIPPSIINDNDRAMMARVAEWRNDISGFNAAMGGTSTAYTFTSYQGIPATPVNGTMLMVIPAITNANAPTLQVDGGNVYPIQAPAGTGIGAGTMVAGTPYTVTFLGVFNAWMLCNVYGNPFSVPIGGAITYFGTTAPNSSFALPFGQAISRTAFPTLFGLLGTTFGAGDGSTTFNIPDVRGRVIAGLDNMGGSSAGRIGVITTDSGTIVGATMGSVGGSSTHVQTNAELSSHGHTGSGNVSDPGHAHHDPSGTGFLVNGGIGSLNGGPGVNWGNQTTTSAAATGITVPSLNINNAGSSNAMAWLQPTMMANQILRII